MIVQPRGEPFFHAGGRVGCLLVHGFPGAPEEMRWLGEHLAGKGFSVLGVRLFGHATRPTDLRHARWRDWVANVEDGYHLLRGACDRVVLMGLSLGGALSLLFAGDWPVDGVVAMSTPFRIPDPRFPYLRPLLPLISLFWRNRSTGEASDWVDREAEKINLHYPYHPVKTIAEVDAILRRMRAALLHIHAPALLIHSKNDGAVPVDHARAIFDHLASPQKELLLVERSGHNLPRDAERERVFEAAERFAARFEEAA